eukprot:CAMPEP_0194209864 /NCGR_PEP_ID=MMETSP0156-20130528/7844_1 /TAXON_ID=33649 /ORGANISM="Thalassionema nitzschioides, Strain L26-B" /LENGTH=1024 /DNA_ID=CAMNT_0038937113 /DNA_START=316 /DNA_END=3390 /DNA_ORIENTATION=-
MWSSSKEVTSHSRDSVIELLREAKLACNRSLFEEIAISNDTPDEHSSKRMKDLTTKMSLRRSWTTILANAASLTPFMTNNEHDLISKYAAIYLLGYLNPHSTGCNFFMLRSTTLQNGLLDAFIDLDLEERLEDTSHSFDANEIGQANVCTDLPRETALKAFLQFGLAALWRERDAANNTDVLHLVAMAIAPQLDTSIIGNIVASWEESQVSAWIKASRLMGCLFAHSFQVRYGLRTLMIKLVLENLLLPITNSPNQMLAGAVPHLLASLHTFSNHAARNARDAHVAHQAMVRIATQTGQEFIVREVFYHILSQTIEDKNNCSCINSEKSFCPHAARGGLLRHCILSFNGSRHHADKTFMEQAIAALSASLEELLLLWQGESEEIPLNNSACLLSSLLCASESFFYFLLDHDSAMQFLEMIIQLLHHSERRVRIAASSLLALAFSYHIAEDKFMTILFESLKAAIELKISQGDTKIQEFNSIVSVAARKSACFASSFLSFVIESRQTKENWSSADKNNDNQIALFASRLIASSALPNGRVAMAKVKAIITLFEAESEKGNILAARHLLTALLSTRYAYIIHHADNEVQNLALRFVSNDSDPWGAYQLARHAMCTGNFSVAKEIYANILQHTSTEKSFLWIGLLLKIAEAETSLNEDGAKGIPHATTCLQAALSYTESIPSQSSYSMMFQIEFLRLRLDFLDLSAVTRLVCQETRLFSTVPKDSNRVGLHLINNIKCWGALASRFFSLYRRHGLFLCTQSRTTLRTMHSICRRIGGISIKLLGEPSFTKTKDYADIDKPKGDEMHPMLRLQKEIENLDLLTKDKFVEPAVSATVLSELMEGLHRAPIPFPKGFIHPVKIPSTKLRISIDPSLKHNAMPQDEIKSLGVSANDSIIVYPGADIIIYAAGSVPDSVMKRAHSTFSRLLLWIKIKCISAPHKKNYEGEGTGQITKDQQEISDNCLYRLHKLEIPASQSNKFTAHMELPTIKSVGIYKIDFKLGCRDIACGEWELPVLDTSNTIVVQVTED